MDTLSKPHILYILPGLIPPPTDPVRDKFSALSEIASGDVLLPVWFKSARQSPEGMRETFPEYRVGSFRYHFSPVCKYPSFLRRLVIAAFYIGTGLRLHRQHRFDAVMAYGSNLPGLCAIILKWITGSKFILEIPGVPEDAYRFEKPDGGIAAFIRRTLASAVLYLTGTFADCFKLLYPEQLHSFPLLRGKKSFVFHDFVPVSVIKPASAQSCDVLLVGHPWYRKGVDILIRAFRLVAPRYPNWTLKLMGYYPNRAPLDVLAKGSKQIEFVSPASNEVALQVIAGCSVYVLASRSEAMGRVLLEAMAAGKPIVSSAVNGTPHYIINGENGILVEAGNVAAMAEALECVLSNPELARSLGEKAKARVFAEYDERAYVRAFSAMLNSVAGGEGVQHSKYEETCCV